MTYFGELISIGVAFSWTATALLSEFGSKRLGNLTLNVLRMALALLFSVVLFCIVVGTPLPPVGSLEACGWMLLSGVVGYVIFDGVDHVGTTDDTHEYCGHVRHAHWHQYFRIRTRRAS